MLSKTYFFHYRGGSSPASIVFQVDEQKKIVVWDAAFCSSKDLFSKKIGRHISWSRLEKNLNRSTYNYFSYSNSTNIREIRWNIVELLPHHPDCPESFTNK